MSVVLKNKAYSIAVFASGLIIGAGSCIYFQNYLQKLIYELRIVRTRLEVLISEIKTLKKNQQNARVDSKDSEDESEEFEEALE
ncbi:unnamed protein product [Dimorphilus gyrociliatus]|uniref:Uncharacterized protein n=1 Tax=Dimorphilus gyrociliatus TaxID=2664684 RepID=A0A7I8VYR3_9ANNE|nr:unnamed protein product [Dimorphilus gyrociliatus]